MNNKEQNVEIKIKEKKVYLTDNKNDMKQRQDFNMFQKETISSALRSGFKRYLSKSPPKKGPKIGPIIGPIPGIADNNPVETPDANPARILSDTSPSADIPDITPAVRPVPIPRITPCFQFDLSS